MYRDVADVPASEAHIAHRGLTLDDARAVLFRHPNLHGPGNNGATKTLGQNDAGRYLAILTVPYETDPDLAFVITARDMSDQEKHAFRRNRRRKQR